MSTPSEEAPKSGGGDASTKAHRARPNLTDPALYIHPEISRLEFNDRVLAQAADPDVPLLERVRFLTIVSTNLDEFFEIRVSGLKEKEKYGVGLTGPDGMPPTEALRQIGWRAHRMVREQYRVLNEELLPALRDEEVRILRRSEWSEPLREWVRETFEAQVLPVLTPTGLDPSHPFPPVQNKALHFMITLKGRDAFGRRSGLAVVKAPRCLPRLMRVPEELAASRDEFVLLSSVIHAHVDRLFPGLKVTGCHQFRVTRNSDLWVDEEEIEDLLLALRGQLPRREYGNAVRLEVADTCAADIADFLLHQFDLEPSDLYQVDGPVNVHRLRALHDMVDRPALKYTPFVPGLPERVAHAEDLFAVIRQSDVLLHHPYQAFTPVLDLLRQAARDPNVLAIKQTLYRTGGDSPVVEALIDAARRGKEVTAVVELLARFDEAANIDLATQMRDAGAHVVYGIVGYKAHAKMLLIVRREGSQLRRYVHVGTGNYHAGTARAYTDVSYMTCDPELTADVHRVFQQLTGLGKLEAHSRILQSPWTLHDVLLELVEAETERARRGEEARIVARVNNLSEPALMRALYRASQAGVQVDLLVRTICCLRPGVPGVSDNIHVRSLVGRFLEHSRAYAFHAGGEQLFYCGSADWMPRNFFRRVELAWPVDKKRLRRRLFRETLELPLEDNAQAWELQADGTWVRTHPGDEPPLRAQEELVRELAVLES